MKVILAPNQKNLLGNIQSQIKFTGFCKKHLYNKVKGSMPKGFDNIFQEWFAFYSSYFFCKIKKPI